MTSYKPEPIITVMREVEHANHFVALHDDWILVCHLHRPNTTEGVDIELPVPGYLLRLDTITVGPMNKDRVLRLTGTYLREKRHR